MARARIDDESGTVAVATVGRIAAGLEGEADGRALAASVDRATLALAVRYTLQLLAEQAPGSTVEVRVPPYGAVRCIDDSFRTEDAQPELIETDAATWLQLATGDLRWADARQRGLVRVSGDRADLAGHLPVLSIP